ncbi:MAG: hypothetical protein Q8O46_02805 [bacterium]|nr:hypothetical protein [bacterium]
MLGVEVEGKGEGDEDFLNGFHGFLSFFLGLVFFCVFVFFYFRDFSCSSMSIRRCSLLVTTTEFVGGANCCLSLSRGFAPTMTTNPPVGAEIIGSKGVEVVSVAETVGGGLVVIGDGAPLRGAANMSANPITNTKKIIFFLIPLLRIFAKFNDNRVLPGTLLKTSSFVPTSHLFLKH